MKTVFGFFFIIFVSPIYLLTLIQTSEVMQTSLDHIGYRH